ncbi:MAG: hotdog fold thioesterase [Saprospirales bacterium]|nr:MAG: hotdog fold thioesterase [Saprospirales bacterium]
MMMDRDAFSQWMGIEILSIKKGSVELQMTITEVMTNGFKIAHGGIAYSLADSALAFSSNTYGIQSVTIESTMSHIKPLKEGETIKAVAKELQLSGKFGRYLIEIINEKNEVAAVFYGTVFRTGKEWIIDNGQPTQ